MLLVNEEYPDPAGKQMMEAQGYFASFGYELHDFSQAILHGKTLDAKAKSAFMDLQIIHAMYNSARTLKWEQIAITNIKGLIANSLICTSQNTNQEKDLNKEKMIALKKISM